MHGGQLAARALKAAGVECIFTLSGGHIMPIYEGCLDEGIRILDVRHEQAAAHAADAWSRVKPGSIGVAVVTAGPGVTDAVTGVANAWRANSPMLVLGGQGPFVNLGKGSLQEMDHVGLMRPITKWAGACYETERIPEYIEIAVRHAIAGVPGPSYLEIPMDILMNEARWEVPVRTIPTRPPRIAPDGGEVAQAVALIRAAQRPMMMVGTSVKWSQAQQELLAFLEFTDIPAYANGMGRGMLPHDSPHLFSSSRRNAMETADLVILAGSVLDFRLAFGQNIPKNAKILQLEMDYTLVGHNRAADVALVGNLAASFEVLTESLRAAGAVQFTEHANGLRAQEAAQRTKAGSHSSAEPASTAGSGKIRAKELCEALAGVVDDDMIVIGDGGDIVAQAAKVLPVPRRGFWLDPGPLGTLGVGMPFALAAQIAHPDKRVLIVYGDGSFGLNGFEYDTAVRHGLPIVGVVGNDAAWGQMMRPQKGIYGRLAATQLAYTRYDKVVEALGGHGEHVTRAEMIRPALERAFASGLPACVNVELEQDQEYRGGSYV